MIELTNPKNTAILYVHGKGGKAEEAEHYKTLFPEVYIYGLDYKTNSPWETNMEIKTAVINLKASYQTVILIANSIGAFFSMNAEICKEIKHAYFISPMVDMEKMISNLMAWTKVTEENLKHEKIIKTDFGEDLSWKYLCYVREHPINWTVPTEILYGSEDKLISYDSIKAFADNTGSNLTIMEGGEHWFHTEEQMEFLDKWISKQDD